jgi:hypothetical protein
VVGRNLTATESAGIVGSRLQSGKSSAEPKTSSRLKRLLKFAGFQHEPPNSIGAAVDAPVIELSIGPALGATRRWPKTGAAHVPRHRNITPT